MKFYGGEYDVKSAKENVTLYNNINIIVQSTTTYVTGRWRKDTSNAQQRRYI